MKRTTIMVSPEVKRALAAHGTTAETYNQVLARLLNMENKESLSDRSESPRQTPIAQSTLEKVTPT